MRTQRLVKLNLVPVRKGGVKVKDEPKDEIRDVTLGRTGFEEGVVLPLIMGWHWATLDPSDNSRFKYMEEVAPALRYFPLTSAGF